MQTAAHTRSLCRARLGTFIALVLSLLATASLLFYMHSQLSEHEAVPVPERVFAWSGLVVGVVAVFYVATLVLSEGHCVKAAQLLCGECSDAMAKARSKVKDCLRKWTHLEPVVNTIHNNISVSTVPGGRHGADTDGAGHLYRAPIGFRCKPAGSWCADGIDSLAADMGLMRATYLDVYRVCRRVMCAVSRVMCAVSVVSLSVCLRRVSTVFPVYHVPCTKQRPV